MYQLFGESRPVPPDPVLLYWAPSSHPASASSAPRRFYPMFGRSSVTRRRRCNFLRLERLEDRATPAAFTPAQIRHAYGFDQVAAVNGTTLDGTGQTIAIIDAYYDATAASDLATFDARYGLP